MANIFYLRGNNDADLRAAHNRLAGITNSDVTFSGSAGWYAVSDAGVATAVASVDTTGADKVYITEALVGRNTANDLTNVNYQAGAGNDTYIVTKAFADGVAAERNSNDTTLTPIDRNGDSTIVFEEGVVIRGARLFGSGNLAISFHGNGTAAQLTVKGTGSTFKLTASGKDLTHQGFLDKIGELDPTTHALRKPFTVGAPEFTAIPALTYTDTAADDAFAIERGTFVAGNNITYSIEEAVALTFVGEFTHEVVGTYGTLRFHETTGAWRYAPDDTAIELLDASASADTDTFTVTATSQAGLTVLTDLVVNITAGADDTNTNTATAITSTLVDDGKANIIIHGVRFTANAAGSEGNTFEIKIGTDNESGVRDATVGPNSSIIRYIINFTANKVGVTPTDIFNLWEGTTGSSTSMSTADGRKLFITAIEVEGLTTDPMSAAQLETAHGTAKVLTGGGPVIAGDAVVTLAYDDVGAVDAASDLMAIGAVRITDHDGITATNVTATATYGTVAITADDDNAGNVTGQFNWTYTLNPDDPDTSALTPGMHKDTIIITVVDDDGSGPTTHEVEVAITITGEAAHLAQAGTQFRPEATSDTGVEVNWTTSTHDLDASGVLTITDTDGIDTITHTAGQYGDFSFDEATGGWTYEINPNDPQTVALTAPATETITFMVTDGAGNTATHMLQIAIAVTGASNNTPPTTTPVTGLTVAEDATHEFVAANFHFAPGTDGDGVDTLKRVLIITLPEVGVLTLGGEAVIAGQAVPMADIGDLIYNPGGAFAPGDPPSATSTASFTYAVIDSENVRSDPATLTIAVTGIDDDEATGISLSETSGTVPSNAPLTTLARIEITDPDGGEAGALELVTPGAAASANLYNAATPRITITAKTAGADGNNITFTLIESNAQFMAAAADAKHDNLPFAFPDPTVAAGVTNIVGYYDPINAVGRSIGRLKTAVANVDAVKDLIEIIVDNALNDTNAFEIATVTLAGGDSTTPASHLEIDQSAARFFIEAAPGRGTDGNKITVTIQDDSSSALPSGTAVMVTADPDGTDATITNIVITYDANGSVTLKQIEDAVNGHAEASKFVVVSRANDDDDTATGFAVAKTTLSGGTADAKGTAGNNRFEITDAGALVLKAGQNLTEDETVTLRVQLENDAKVGGTYTLTVGGVNAIPTATAATGLEVSEDNFVLLGLGLFGFADTDMGDDLQSITIVTPPSHGMLTLDGVMVKAGQVITLAEIESDTLIYTPPNTFNTDTPVTFTYSVSDGKHESTDAVGASATMMTIMVEADDDKATGVALTDALETVPENAVTADRRKVAGIMLTDSDGGPKGLEVVEDASTQASVSVMASGGSTGDPALVLTAVDGGADGNDITIMVAEDAGLPPDNPGTPANEAVLITVTGNAIVVSFDDSAVTLKEIADAINADPMANKLVTASRMDDDDNASVAAFAVAQTNLANGTTATRPSTKFELNTEMTELHLKDDITIMKGEVLSVRVRLVGDDSVRADYSVTVNAVPTAANQSVDVVEEASYTFKMGDFGFMDGDTGDSLVSVTIVTLPSDGMLTLDGVVLTADNLATLGTILVADITAGNLVYTPPNSFTANTPVTFTYSVSDGKHESTDGTDDNNMAIPAATMTIMVEADDDIATVLTLDNATPTLQKAAAVAGLKVADITLTDTDGGSPGMVVLGGISARFSFADPGVATDPPTLMATAVKAGAEGNAVIVTIRSDADLTGDDMLADDMDDATDGNQPEKVRVAAQGTSITITYNADAAGGVTLKDIVDAVNAHTAASALATFSKENDADDMAMAFEAATQPLSGGVMSDVFAIAGNELRLSGKATEISDNTMLSVRVQLMEDPNIGADYHLTIGAPNTAPTTTPETGLMVAENMTHTFTAANFGFMDADNDDADPANDDVLVSVTIVTLPPKGALLLDGAAVVAGQVIMAAAIPNLTYAPMDAFLPSDNTPNPDPGSAPSAPATFRYTVSDGRDSSTAATMNIAVTGANDDAPQPAIVAAIAFDRGEDSGAFVFTRQHFKANDLDTPASGLTYTLATFDFTGDTNAAVQTYDSANDMWNALTAGTSGSDTFTQEQIDNGHVRLNAASGSGMLSVRISDGTTTIPSTAAPAEEITVTVRVVETPMATDIGDAGGAEGLNFFKDDATPAEKATPRSLTTGIGDTKITLGSGNDKVDAGLGDDEIDLTSGGKDVVIYRFGTDAMGNIVAWSGGDAITGFTPGDDALVLSDLAGGDGGSGDAFVDNLGTGFIATLATNYTGGTGGDRTSLDNYSITGVEIHFAQAVVLPGGVLGGSILSITFNAPIAWAGANGFNATWLNGAAGPETDTDAPFNIDDLTFNDNAAGKMTLTRILGLRGPEADDEVEALRSVAIGDEMANTIDLSDKSGAWVVFGGGGDDIITLGADTPPPTGATPPVPDTEEPEEIVYRLVVGDDPSTPGTDAITAAPDGNDMVTGFDLGTDMLTFVDTDGTPPAATPATNDTPEISAVDKLMAAFDSVSLNYDGTDYTGITFGVVAADATATTPVEAVNLQVTFADALDADGLATALGSTIANAAALGTIFTDGVPTPGSAASAALNAAGLALIDTLFGMTGDENNISIGASLPAELL